MSGDVQPRKRKDKKKKKDDPAGEQIPQPPIIPVRNETEDTNIHVHKEEGTGGGICAKIVFFFLFSALAVLIGLIITEHRGLTDLDTVDSDSRFSHLFEGWTDVSKSHDDEDDHLDHIIDHEDAHEEDDAHEDHDGSHELEAEESEENADESEEGEEPVTEEDTEEDDDEPAASHEEEDEDEQDDDDEAEDKIIDEDDDNEENASEEQAEAASEEQPASAESEGADEDDDEEETAKSAEEEGDDKDSEDNAPESAEDEGDDAGGAPEDSAEKEDRPKKEPFKKSRSAERKSAEVATDAESETEGSSKMAVKIGVGVALLVVAYVVLVRKWKSAPSQTSTEEPQQEMLADARRRNTIVIPPELQEVEQDIEEVVEEDVNVPPGDEPDESDSDKQSDDPETYEYENITSKEDWDIKDKLEEAEKASHQSAAYAIKLFDVLLRHYPSSPRSMYGKAKALDGLAEQRRSNEILQQATEAYLKLLRLDKVPDALFEAAADRCINRLRFVGNHNRAVEVHNMLINRFPKEPKHRNQLAVTYLILNRVDKARSVLKETLSNHPDDGFALVHYGFILKTGDNNLDEATLYLKKGLASGDPQVIDGRFYFHLGDALSRLGRPEEAMQVYEEAVVHKLFLSKHQRSLYNEANLKGQAWWSKQEIPYERLLSALESQWKRIRDEALAVLSHDGYFQNETENLRDTGDWKQFELFARGQKNVANCKKCPVTCGIIESFPEARGCKRGQIKFSVMHPGTHVWPHCGPTNCRLRVHLGLKVPPNTFIRVVNDTRSWENGKVLIFDDSFEHEVWHNGSTFRLVLIVDVWHPDLTPAQRRGLPPI